MTPPRSGRGRGGDHAPSSQVSERFRVAMGLRDARRGRARSMSPAPKMPSTSPVSGLTFAGAEDFEAG